MRCLPILLLLAFLWSFLLTGAVLAAVPRNAPTNSDIAHGLELAAQRERIPTVLLKGLAWKCSRWQMTGGDATLAGILQVPTRDRVDAERLRSDWRYNIDEGAKRLAFFFFRTPVIGNGRLEDGRNILECWYFALGRYGGTRERAADNDTFANAVLDAIASGGNGRWAGVTITRPSPEKLAWGRGMIGAPVPWHFGDVRPRPKIGELGAEVRVDLPVPYLSQVWDTPDNFDGGGACGPTSMMMVLAFARKLPPRPISIHDSYQHVSEWGGHIPDIQKAVCEPELGAVHARMLDYFRPYFPKVAIFYDAKATYTRVRKELDAGHPVILGTQVTPAGHLMVARGYLADGRLLVNDPAGNYYEAAVKGNPFGLWSPTGNRYWNGDGERAVYDWDALSVRWIMTFDADGNEADHAEDENLRKP